MVKKQFLLFLILVIGFFTFEKAWAQQTDTTSININEVLVNTYKFPEKRKRVAQTTLSINNKALLNLSPNTADVLMSTGAVYVQKSQQGGGSPIIRGFEASRVLLMVDGVRLNNAIYRTGHLQNIVTVDNMVLDKMEVLYGPSSTLYGSDALGGVVIMSTKNPVLSPSKNTTTTGAATIKYASAIEEARANAQINIGGKKFASFTSITMGSFGDVTQGNNYSHNYPTFGKKIFVVKRVNNVDTAMLNPNPSKQSPSGYQQIDVTQKLLYQPNATEHHILNFQYSNSTNIPRYDRLTELIVNTPAFAEWYYGPQLRSMLAYSFNKKVDNSFFSLVNITANYQKIKESRVTRRFKSNNKDFRWEGVDILGLTIDAKHMGKKYEWHIGAEYYVNFVNSTAQRLNILTGINSKIQTRYSDGPTNTSSMAVYAQNTIKFNNNLTLNSGIRFNYATLDAIFKDTSIMQLPFTNAIQRNFAITGNVGLVYSQQSSKLAFLLSSGFRSANVDDLSKVFETNVGRVIVPNANVKPEYTYNAEANYTYFGSKFSVGTSIFYTLFKNAIAVDKFTFNGMDSINYNGINSVVVAPQNKAEAFINGFSIHASLKLLKTINIHAVYTYTYGRYFNNEVTVPLDHVPPIYGKISILHKKDTWQAELFAMYNGWKKLKDYSPSGEDNLQYATVDGMPSWITLNARLAKQFSDKIAFQASVENIFDMHYRYFASGISAPGRNLMLSIKYSF